MKWLINSKTIAKDLIKTTKIPIKKDTINVYAYVLTDRKYVAYVTDRVKVSLLKEIIGDTYEVKMEKVFAKNRKRELVDTRHCLSYYIRRHTKYSFSEIGKLLGDRNHATIINSCKVYSDLLDTEVYHRRKSLIIQEEYNKRLRDVDLTNSYISKSKLVISNWDNMKEEFLNR
tara:strand:- start:2284 stop:2802 length:519 start_codon:yes stop_codon:yes gene_type:complete